MSLALQAIEKDGIVRIAATGQLLGSELSPSGVNPFTTILGSTWNQHRVVLDMSQTTYMDSAALGWLLGSHQEFKAGQGRLIIHSVTTHVLDIFKLLRLDKLFVVVTDESAALAQLRESSKP